MTLRIVSQGTTVIKSITVGTPIGIADPSIGRLTRLDDVFLGVDSPGDLADEQSLFWSETNQRFEFADPGTVIRDTFTASNLGGDGSLVYDNENGIFQYTGPVASETRAHFTAIDSGGDGSFSYDSSTGSFTYRGPSPEEARAHFSVTNVSGDGTLSYSPASGIISYTGPSIQTYRDNFSAEQIGGDGTFTYDSSNGRFTYSGPTAEDVRGHVSAGLGLAYDENLGVFSIPDTFDSGTYGSGSQIPILLVNRRGIVDSIGTVPIAGVQSTTWSSTASTLTINTVDGQTFDTIIDSFGGNLRVGENLLIGGVTTINDSATINGNLTINGELDLNGGITVSGHILPDTNLTYNVGDSNLRFNELWLAGSTIHLGTLNLKDSDGEFTVQDVNGDTVKLDLSLNSTDDLAEGSSNLYYTDQRARSTQSITNTSGTTILFSYDSLTGIISTRDSDIARTNIRELFHEGIQFPDGQGVFIGDDNDFQMYHDGSNSYIDNAGTGDIKLRSDTFTISDAAGTKTSAVFNSGGSQDLYYNNNKKFETTDSGGKLTGNLDVTGELEVDGSVLITGNLQVDGTTTTINSTTLSVNDKNIVLADSAGDASEADGAGITVAGANATITYNYTADRWQFNKAFERNINLISEHSTTDLSEGTNRYYTLARVDSDARHALSVTDNGGDGSLDYNSTTGVITYVGPSATEVRAHLSAGRRLDYNSGTGVFDVTFQSNNVFGSYGTNSAVPTFSVDSHGFITDISTTSINAITSFTYDSANGKFNIGTTGSDFELPYNLDAFTTDDLTEGTNLYYTKVRTDSDVNQGFVDRLTDDLAEGSNNLYYTKARTDSDVNQGFVDRSTTQLVEGSNLYYTKVRVDSDVNQGFADRSTTNLVEGNNLYYIKARVDSDVNQGFTDRLTDDLTEGSNNLYYTKARVDSDVNQGFADRSTTDVVEGDNLYYTTARADSDAKNAIGVSGDLLYNASTGIISIDVEQVYSKANFDSDLGDASTTILPEGTNLYYTKARTDSDVNQGFADRSTTNLVEGNNLYYTTARADSDARHSITVVDNGGDGSLTYNNGTGDIVYTGPSATEVRSHFSSSQDLSYDSSTGTFSIDVEQIYSKANFDSDLGDASTTILPEGTNLYYTTARADSDAKNSVSVTDNGGDGSLSYNPANGIITYTGPSAAEVRAHLSGGVGVTITDGVVEIGQEVDSAADVTFASITNTTGDVTTLPSDVTISTTNETVIDQFEHGSTDVSFEYLIHMIDANDDTQVTKMLGTFNGSAVASNEYGTVFTGSTDFGDLNITADGTYIKLVLNKYGSVGTVTAKASKTIIK